MNELFNIEQNTVPVKPKRKPTPAQAAILGMMVGNTISKQDVMKSDFVAARYRYGMDKHVGAILSRMVKAGILERVKPGLFKRRAWPV